MAIRNFIYTICFLFILALTQQVNGQCYKERHSTNWHDSWTSCEMAPSPNTDRPVSHWIMYDLVNEHRLDRTHVWNYNDVNNLGNGIQEVAIDYSLDGTNWTNAGTYTFAQADGSPTYAGASGPNLGGINARYVLLTAMSNYGGDCFAMSEIRIEAEEINVAVNDPTNEHVCLQVDIFPNPMRNETRVYVESDCKGDVEFQLINLLGEIVSKGEISATIAESGYFNLRGDQLNAGEYILQVGNAEGSIRKPVIKL